jgi:hypothetical protein
VKAAAGDSGLVFESGAGDAFEAGQSITDDDGIRFKWRLAKQSTSRLRKPVTLAWRFPVGWPSSLQD